MASNLIGTRHVATPGSRSYAVERKLDADFVDDWVEGTDHTT